MKQPIFGQGRILFEHYPRKRSLAAKEGGGIVAKFDTSDEGNDGMPESAKRPKTASENKKGNHSTPGTGSAIRPFFKLPGPSLETHTWTVRGGGH